MDEMLYNSLSQYFATLQKTGYYKYSDMQKLLILAFYKDFVYNDFRGILSRDNYRLIERALDCLYGSTCLIPYPDYLKSGNFHLGATTSLSRRLQELENTNVLKPIEAEDSNDSDVIVLDNSEDYISFFNVSPQSIMDATSSVIHFEVLATKTVELQIILVYQGSRTTIYGPVTGTQINYDYVLDAPIAGKAVFELIATCDGTKSIARRTITIQDVPITISSFTISPASIYAVEKTTLIFIGEANRPGELSIFHQNGSLLYEVTETSSIHYAYDVLPSDASTLHFTLQAKCGNKQLVSQQAEVQVKQHEYYAMYYGNLDTEVSDGAEIKALKTANKHVVEDTYNKAYYYIAVHSSKSLKSIINRGVENVTENFVLKNDALVLDVFGTQQTYKLYECNINADAEAWDMYTFILTITIE